MKNESMTGHMGLHYEDKIKDQFYNILMSVWTPKQYMTIHIWWCVTSD